jgi:hypothetical protein
VSNDKQVTSSDLSPQFNAAKFRERASENQGQVEIRSAYLTKHSIHNLDNGVGDSMRPKKVFYR